MNSQRTASTLTKVSEEQMQLIWLQRVIRYALCAGMGLVSGAVGVAVTIGLVIIVQSLLFPTTFSPGAMLIAIAASLISLGVGWLASWVARRLLPELFVQLEERALQVILVFSVLTSLLQTILFTSTF
jgi:hypothetical protein